MINNICICVCFYNTNPEYLEDCFFSIDNAIQFFKKSYDYVPVEVHVMDDGTDRQDTLDMFYNQIMNKYPYIKYWKHNRNTTLATAINDLHIHTPMHALVVYIDSDDMMMYNRLVVQWEVMTKYDRWKDITLCASNTVNPNLYNDNEDKIVNYYWKTFNKLDNFYNKRNFICHPSICYKIDNIKKYKVMYDSNFKCLQDFDFYCQILLNNLKILLIPDALTYWRQHNDKPDNDRKYLYELIKLRKKYNTKNLYI